MLTFCTHFDSAYYPHGASLIASMQEHCRPFHLIVLALDGECEDRIAAEIPDRGDDDAKIDIMGLREFENFSSHVLRAQRENHTWQEYCWLLEPVLIEFMLTRKFDSFCYVDSDSYFFAPIANTIAEIPKTAYVALTPHRFPVRMAHREEVVGRYNFGFGWFRKTQLTCGLVENWATSTLQKCDAHRAGGQRYLNALALALGNKLHELPATVNVGPWQIPDVFGEPPVIDKQKLIHMHFHECRNSKRGANLVEVKPGVSFNLTNYRLPYWTRNSVYEPYLKELKKHV